MYLDLKNGPFVPHNLLPGHGSPARLLKFQMAPRFRLLMSSGSKKEEPRYACLSEAKASHSHRMWAELSSSTPHLLHKGLLVRPIKWRCHLRVSRPVRRPVMTLVCVVVLDWPLTRHTTNHSIIPALLQSHSHHQIYRNYNHRVNMSPFKFTCHFHITFSHSESQLQNNATAFNVPLTFHQVHALKYFSLSWKQFYNRSTLPFPLYPSNFLGFSSSTACHTR